MIISNNKPFTAISYDTVTFRDLKYWMKTFHDIEIERLDPDIALEQLSPSYQYMNLITRDISIREKISKKLDHENADRFTFVHPKASVDIDLSPSGILIYPNVSIYPNAVIGKDVIVHGNSLIAHLVNVGNGSYISASASIAGTTKIGEYCVIGLSAILFDNLTICSYVTIGAGAQVRKNIDLPGTYFSTWDLKKK